MVLLARAAELFGFNPQTQDLSQGNTQYAFSSQHNAPAPDPAESANSSLQEEVEGHPHLVHSALAGGFGGLAGDMLMHSLDTVKTRQQGDPHRPPKYSSLGNTYFTIWRQEGIRRGLYGGVAPAFLGSFGGTCIFFGTYEWSKRIMIDQGITPSISYFSAGWVADLAASPLYVPTEVVKTRLQLQGRYNNPHFSSGYNYRSTLNAARTIYRVEGLPALFYGFRATLYRDLPFSALQFFFYEQEREAAKWWVGSSNIGLPLEILVGATAGGAAGSMTCPLDVVKTRIQTQLNPSSVDKATKPSPSSMGVGSKGGSTPVQTQQKRNIAGSAPATPIRSGSVPLDTSSVLKGLRIIYRAEGISGWFRGVGPRAVWTSIQSGTMLVLYQVLLQQFEQYPIVRD